MGSTPMNNNKMLASYVFSAKYSKYMPELLRRETYEEAMDRYVDMLLRKFPYLDRELEECRISLKAKKLVGSQRGVQFGGVGVETNNLRLYNCSTIHIDRVRAFSETLYLLLCGCGVGFSVQKHHIEKLPELKLNNKVYYHAVGDSIEGWAVAAEALFNAYLSGGSYPNFDFSGVRPKGAAISHGGKAPGPEPLKLALSKCDAILRNALGRKLKPIEAFDCCMHLSDAVVSGGIRRSAALTLFSIDDEEMLTAKTGNWFIDNPQRGRANISALISPDTTEEQFKAIFSSTRQFGEPGFLFLNSSEHLLNPCVSGDTLVLTTDGYKRIDSLVGKKTELVLDPRFGKGKTGWTTDRGAFVTGVKQLYRLDTDEGYTVELTAEHQVMTARGWVEAQHLVAGDKIHLVNSVQEQCLTTFTSLTPTRIDTVYDLTQPDTSSFIANGLVVHNCAEVAMCPVLVKDPTGDIVEDYTLELVDPKNRSYFEDLGYTFESGVSLCNLTEINMTKVTSIEDFYECCRLASILGTLQASYTDFKYLGGASKHIVEREALLGVSITGVFSNTMFNSDEIMNKGAAIVASTNVQYANTIGIKEASRTTLIKPSGTASIVLESAPGIHPWHAAKYIRRVQADAFEPLYKYVEAIQPQRCFKSVWGGEHARVIAFACEAPEGAVVKSDINAVEHLSIIKRVNKEWVRPGTLHPNRLEGAYHNVSCTVTVRPDEWDLVADYLFHNRAFFTGVSLLGGSGDYDYEQAPLQEVTSSDTWKDNEVQRSYTLELWNKLSVLPDIDLSQCVELEDTTEQIQAVACAGGQCDITFAMPHMEDEPAEQVATDAPEEVSLETKHALNLLIEVAKPLLRESTKIMDELSALLRKYL